MISVKRYRFRILVNKRQIVIKTKMPISWDIKYKKRSKANKTQDLVSFVYHSI